MSLEPGLYLVATPIGNLEDITLRALRVLKKVDRITCEDTRRTQKLLNDFDIPTSTISYHEHNEQSRTLELIALLTTGWPSRSGQRCRYACFLRSWTRSVRAAVEAGVPVIPIPGANAALAALDRSGLDTDRFLYVRFLAAKPGTRRTELEALAALACRASPWSFMKLRIASWRRLADVEAVWGNAAGGGSPGADKTARGFLRGTAREVRSELAARDRIRGEIVLLIDAAPVAQPPMPVAVSRSRCRS